MRNWQLSALLQSIIVLFWSLKAQFSSLKASSSVHTEGFFSHSVASLPVSITTRAKCQHPAADWGLGDPQWSSFGREEFPVACPVSSCSLFEMLLWTDIHGSPLVVSVKAALNVSIGIDKHVNRSLAGREACTVQAQAMNLHTPGSAVHLTCRWWRGRWRGSSRFNYSFFFSLSFWHPAITLSLPAGSRKVSAKPLFWLGFSNTQFWPPEELLFSLARVKALHHLSPSDTLSCSLSPIVSCQICLHSEGLVKLPGRNNSKHRTGPTSPVSHKLLQTFLFH